MDPPYHLPERSYSPSFGIGICSRRRHGDDLDNETALASQTPPADYLSAHHAEAGSQSLVVFPSVAPHFVINSKQGIYASQEDWETHRTTITRLYLYEEMTLKQVRKHMEDTHFFYATEKMYKMRIKKWGLEKYNNMARVAYMVRLKKERDAVGKKSDFTVRSRPVDWADIERYLKRKPDVIAKIESGVVEVGNAAMGIVCRTPSPDPAVMMSVPPRLEGPREVGATGDVLGLFRDYMDGSFDSGLWRYSEVAKSYLGPQGMIANYRMCTWTSDVWTAVKRGKDDGEIIQRLNELMDHLGALIKDQDVALFTELIRCFYYLYTWRPAVCRLVICFVADLCEVILSARHPLTLAWRCLLSLDIEGFQAVLEKSAMFRLEYIASRDQGDRTRALSLEDYFLALTMRWQHNGEEIGRVIDWIDEQVHRRPGDVITGDYCRLLLRLAMPRIFFGHHKKAARTLSQISAWLDENDSTNPYFTYINSSFSFLRALYYTDIDEPEAAKRWADRGVQSCIRSWHPSKHLLSHTINYLMGFGTNSNPEKEALWTSIMEDAVRQTNAAWTSSRKQFASLYERKDNAPGDQLVQRSGLEKAAERASRDSCHQCGDNNSKGSPELKPIDGEDKYFPDRDHSKCISGATIDHDGNPRVHGECCVIIGCNYEGLCSRIDCIEYREKMIKDEENRETEYPGPRDFGENPETR
ncbi:hypothetical protein B0H67DRAFT_642710 [Lasiosphaeris hirsuta]|uniref:Clr5 domain-containing protein n=1 Tax=Lasiosphaeris hirsuta TaxID=260670 RepID=A0AA40DZH7_9PEZI|nr:hypothetical protein B0H67DRAFT_642710 [Lasiosphaeris hirsuta]